ncbi:MAG: hypothetical protein WCK28_19090, partial [Burkholderiales bacterium]
AAKWDAHFGRPSGGSLYEFQLRLGRDDVGLFAGRGVGGGIYERKYRNIRKDPRLYARACGEAVAKAGSPYVPGAPPECCN